jgi:hypothetical protein
MICGGQYSYSTENKVPNGWVYLLMKHITYINQIMRRVRTIEILLQVMENQRDDVVILAGYKEPMDKFYNIKPGFIFTYC